MSRTLYFYLPHPVDVLKDLVEAHQQRFEQTLKDTFDDDELAGFESLLDSIAAISVDPIISEMSFEDFYADPHQETAQRDFFSHCLSCISLENLPFLESHAFQVSYLQELLALFDEVLIDRGGVSELCFKKTYLEELSGLRSLEHFLGPKIPARKETKKFQPVDPIDFLVLDVYKELERLRSKSLLPTWQNVPDEKAKKLFYVMEKEFLDPASLYSKSGLSAKDFDDYLEKLKFWLRSIT